MGIIGHVFFSLLFLVWLVVAVAIQLVTVSLVCRMSSISSKISLLIQMLVYLVALLCLYTRPRTSWPAASMGAEFERYVWPIGLIAHVSLFLSLSRWLDVDDEMKLNVGDMNLHRTCTVVPSEDITEQLSKRVGCRSARASPASIDQISVHKPQTSEGYSGGIEH